MSAAYLLKREMVNPGPNALAAQANPDIFCSSPVDFLSQILNIYLYTIETECVGPDYPVRIAQADLVRYITLRRVYNVGFHVERLLFYFPQNVFKYVIHYTLHYHL